MADLDAHEAMQDNLMEQRRNDEIILDGLFLHLVHSGFPLALEIIVMLIVGMQAAMEFEVGKACLVVSLVVVRAPMKNPVKWTCFFRFFLFFRTGSEARFDRRKEFDIQPSSTQLYPGKKMFLKRGKLSSMIDGGTFRSDRYLARGREGMDFSRTCGT
jgi:hypothetical protein